MAMIRTVQSTGLLAFWRTGNVSNKVYSASRSSWNQVSLANHEPFAASTLDRRLQNTRTPDDPLLDDRVRWRTGGNSRGHQPVKASLEDGRHSRLRPGLDRHRRAEQPLLCNGAR